MTRVCVRAATPVALRLAPLAQGEVAAVKVERHPRPLPALSFNDPEGRPIGVEVLGEADWASALVTLAMRGRVRIV